MRFTSLRGRIFIFVVLLLIFGAGSVMIVTQHDVTNTVTAAEERAVDNTLRLIARDSMARWAGLLNEKVTIARQARQPLIHYEQMIAAVLDVYMQQHNGTADADEASRRNALQWVNQLRIGMRARVLILDNELQVLADSRQQLAGRSLAGHIDIKGRPLAHIVDHELAAGNHSFVIYRNSTDSHGSLELRYMILTRFPAWDWVIAVSDSAQHMVDQFEQQRAGMEAAVAETIESIRFAGHGFAFITDQEGQLVTPLPIRYADFNQRIDQTDGRPLSEKLKAAPAADNPTGFSFRPHPETGADQDDLWFIKTTYIKPLQWTLVAAVPEHGLTHPATELRNRIGLLFVAGLFVALTLAWLLSAYITGPLRQLTEAARRLPGKDLAQAASLPPHIERLSQQHDDEVGDLATAFIQMDAQLREKIIRLLDETSRRERFEGELDIARSIQTGLLPTSLPPAITGHLDLHAAMIPARKVGGDLYDYFILTDGRLCFAIGDVSDKGIAAALFMAMTRILLRACAEGCDNPARLMSNINARLAADNPNMMFVTLIIGMLDLDTGTLTWANGGHPPLSIVTREGQVRQLGGRSGPACGVLSDQDYQGWRTKLDIGETLLGYTDGIPEASNPERQQYGEQRLHQRLYEAGTSFLSTRQLADTILDDVRTFADDNDQSDDITLIVLRRIR